MMMCDLTTGIDAGQRNSPELRGMRYTALVMYGLRRSDGGTAVRWGRKRRDRNSESGVGLARCPTRTELERGVVV